MAAVLLRGVEVRSIAINRGRWDCTLEDAGGGCKAVRLGLRMIRDLSNADAAAVVATRGDQPFASIEEIQRRSGVGRGALDRMAMPTDSDRLPAAGRGYGK